MAPLGQNTPHRRSGAARTAPRCAERHDTPMWISRWRRRRGRVAVVAAAALASGLATTAVALVAAPGANAATGCQVTYTPNSWTGGFTAAIKVSGGDQALHGWTVTWTYGGDQRISSGWN